jgi:hypothetical protein
MFPANTSQIIMDSPNQKRKLYDEHMSPKNKKQRNEEEPRELEGEELDLLLELQEDDEMQVEVQVKEVMEVKETEEDKKAPTKKKKKKNKDAQPKITNSMLPSSDAKVGVHFNSKHGLATLLEGIGPMLSDCTFNIACGDSDEFNQTKLSTSLLKEDKDREKFSGIYLEALDTTHSCVVIGKIKASVIINKENPPDKDDMSFCVSVQTFLTHIKSVNSSYCVQLYRTAKSSDVHMKTFSPSIGRHHRLMTLGTLNKELETFGVNDIDYPHTVEFELFEFRSIVKMAKGINCDNLRFRILETKGTSKVQRSYFIVHIYGENSYDEHCFCSLTDIDEGDGKSNNTIVIKNSELTDVDDDPVNVSLDELDEKFNNIFAVDFLNSFLKALDRSTVTIRLAQDQPMTITSSLGDEHSFLTYMLAPKEDSDSLPNIIQSFGAK